MNGAKSTGLEGNAKERRAKELLTRKPSEERREGYEKALVDAIMVTRDYSPADVDRLTGYTPGNFAVERCKGFTSMRYRVALEKALRCCIWSDPAIFDLRCCCLHRYGVDPSMAEMPELRQLITQIGIEHRAPANASRDQLLETVFQHCAIYDLKKTTK